METKVGPETTLDATVKDGKIVFSTAYEGTDLSAGAFIAASPSQITAALAKLIPGDSAAEHAALAVVQGALDLAAKIA